MLCKLLFVLVFSRSLQPFLNLFYSTARISRIMVDCTKLNFCSAKVLFMNTGLTQTEFHINVLKCPSEQDVNYHQAQDVGPFQSATANFKMPMNRIPSKQRLQCNGK